MTNIEYIQNKYKRKNVHSSVQYIKLPLPGQQGFLLCRGISVGAN